MARRGSWRRRSWAECGVRLVLAAVLGLTGYRAVSHNFALSIRGSDPARAQALAPGDGRIAASLSEKLAGAEATAHDRARADAVARRALDRDPTAVAAVATLGIDAQIRGDTATARRWFAYSQALSRRDLRTQLWAIEYAVSRGDVPGALTHYDLALRTSSRAPGLLFPVLAAAIAQPPVRIGMVRTLAGRPLWAGGFIDYVAGNGPDPRATAALFRSLAHRLPLSGDAQAMVVGSLFAHDMFDDAWRYYAALHPGTDRRLSRDPQFAVQAGLPSPLDWVPASDPAMSASIQRGGRGGVFDFAVPASVGGPLLTQIQMLPAGDYRIQGHSVDIDQPDNSRPYWVLTCRTDGREFGRVALPNSATANGSFAGRFSVPAGCPVQVLSLVARPSDTVSGVSGQIDRVQLRPLR